jgi:hypothetical protein
MAKDFSDAEAGTNTRKPRDRRLDRDDERLGAENSLRVVESQKNVRINEFDCVVRPFSASSLRDADAGHGHLLKQMR